MGRVKLLSKTFRLYLLCSIAILLVAAPVFYFSISRLYIRDVDDALLLFKKEFHHYYLPGFRISDVDNWNRFNRDLKLTPIVNPIGADTFYYKTIMDSLENENEPYRLLQSPVVIEDKHYIFTAKISLVESEDLVMQIAIIFVLLITVLLIVLAFVTNRVSTKIWQPFKSTLGKLRVFDLTKQESVVFDKTNILEFDDLHQSLKKLMNDNISIYKQQKAFIENASHELQTPLAVLKSKLELLLQNSEITEKQSEIINAINVPLSRVSRINKNLLLLAKIENNQFADKENIELGGLLSETLELMSDYILAKQITIDKNIEDTLTLTCNKTLLEILASNLLINAIIHNTLHGHIRILVAGNLFSVSNTGTKALNEKTIFDRFSVSSSQIASSGLGLAIATEICNRYGWQLTYHYRNNFHSFVIQF